MSEKYTVENSYASYSHSYCVKKDNEVFEYFRNKEKSELVCRLLNEDEKRKSAPRIDKNIKAELIKAFNIKSKHSEFEEINNKWKQIVKVIELLECE